jgi:hypothetical protein
MPLNLNGNVISSTSLSSGSFVGSFSTDGLVMHVDPLNLNSYVGSGTNIYDIARSNYTGSLTNSPTYATGSITLNGSSQYINMNASGIVPAGASSYSVSAWLYRTRNNAGYEEILSQWTSGNSGNSFYFGFNNSDIRFTDSWPTAVSGVASTINSWINIVGVNFGGSNAHVYLNGNIVASKGSALTYTGTANFIIGQQGSLNSEYFSGKIGQILVYNKALNKGEILSNYYSIKSRYGL